MPIRIITDSASDIVSPQREEITVLPMTISFEDQHYQDGVNLTHQQFYEYLIEGDTLPISSQVSPGEFSEAFQRAVAAGETVVTVTLSKSSPALGRAPVWPRRTIRGRSMWWTAKMPPLER